MQYTLTSILLLRNRQCLMNLLTMSSNNISSQSVHRQRLAPPYWLISLRPNLSPDSWSGPSYRSWLLGSVLFLCRLGVVVYHQAQSLKRFYE
jgi:hypothetical protein